MIGLESISLWLNTTLPHLFLKKKVSKIQEQTIVQKLFSKFRRVFKIIHIQIYENMLEKVYFTNKMNLNFGFVQD